MLKDFRYFNKMLDDDLKELYQLSKEEVEIKQEIADIKNKLIDVRNNIEEVKFKVLRGMGDIKHKYAQCKDMTVTLVKKPEKIKLKKEEIEDVIEQILCAQMDNIEKKDHILQAFKAKESGKTSQHLEVKFSKKNKNKNN